MYASQLAAFNKQRFKLISPLLAANATFKQQTPRETTRKTNRCIMVINYNDQQ